jgi:ornithine cyclodeaminase/alanine dehydrogenase-like protein (mu-crystallin family)
MYISEDQIRRVLTYEELIPAIRQSLIDYSAGRVEQPLRSVLRVKDPSGNPSGWFAVMPVIAGGFMAVKTVTFFPGNKGLPTHLATIELLARATGEPLAVMDGRLITEMRTAAVSAVAVEALAPDAKTLGILGSGVQARSHIEALRLIQPAFREPGSIRIWSRNPDNAAALANELNATAANIEEAASSDVVITVTSATQPVLQGKWLTGKSLVVAVGAVGPQLRELDDETMRLSHCRIAPGLRERVRRRNSLRRESLRRDRRNSRRQRSTSTTQPSRLQVPRHGHRRPHRRRPHLAGSQRSLSPGT